MRMAQLFVQHSRKSFTRCETSVFLYRLQTIVVIPKCIIRIVRCDILTNLFICLFKSPWRNSFLTDFNKLRHVWLFKALFEGARFTNFIKIRPKSLADACRFHLIFRRVFRNPILRSLNILSKVPENKTACSWSKELTNNYPVRMADRCRIWRERKTGKAWSEREKGRKDARKHCVINNQIIVHWFHLNEWNSKWRLITFDSRDSWTGKILSKRWKYNR